MPSKPSSASAVSSEAARVWTTTALPSSAGELELPLEELALAVVRRVVAVEVEPRLADRDGALVARAARGARRDARRRRQRPGAGGSRARRRRPRCSRGDRERLAAGVEPGADRDDPLDPGRRARARRAPPPARRTRRGARACRSSRCGRQVDAREERRRRLDPLGLGREPGRDPLRVELDRLAAARRGSAAPSPGGRARARRRPRGRRPRGRRARGRARPRAPRPSRAATAPSPRRGGSASARPPRSSSSAPVRSYASKRSTSFARSASSRAASSAFASPGSIRPSR